MALGEAARPTVAVATAATPAATTAPPDITLRTGRGRILLGGFTAAHFSHHVSNSLLNPLLPVIRDSFALYLRPVGPARLGVQPEPGALQRANRRPGRQGRVAAGDRLGLILTGLVSAAVAFSTEYWHLLALLVVMGLIAGSYHAPTWRPAWDPTSGTRRLAPPELRTRSL